MLMAADCMAYAAVRQRNAHLFEGLGGWQQVVHREVPVAEMRMFCAPAALFGGWFPVWMLSCL